MAASLVSVACGNEGHLEPEQATSFPGDQGILEFSYDVRPVLLSLDDCDAASLAQKPLLTGSEVWMTVKGPPAQEAGLTFHSSAPDLVRVDAWYECTCQQSDEEGSRVKDILVEEACEPGWQRSCHYRLDLQANTPITTRVEVRDAAGAVVDSTRFRFADPASVTLVASREVSGDEEELSGPLELQVGESVWLSPRMHAADGAEVILGNNLDWELSDGVARIEPCEVACDDRKVLITGVTRGESELMMATSTAEWTLEVKVR